MTENEYNYKINELENEINRLEEYVCELEEQKQELVYKIESIKETGIYDIALFKFKLSLNNLLTPELEAYIEEYLRYYNEGGE